MMVNFQGLNTYSCFVAVFLSHGENECLNCVDGQDVSYHSCCTDYLVM